MNGMHSRQFVALFDVPISLPAPNSALDCSRHARRHGSFVGRVFFATEYTRHEDDSNISWQMLGIPVANTIISVELGWKN